MQTSRKVSYMGPRSKRLDEISGLALLLQLSLFGYILYSRSYVHFVLRESTIVFCAHYTQPNSEISTKFHYSSRYCLIK